MRTLILAAALTLAATAGVAQPAAPPALATIFKAWDTDGDGAVSKAEWVAAGRPAERFDLIDADKDGKVTMAEVVQGIARQRQGG